MRASLIGQAIRLKNNFVRMKLRTSLTLLSLFFALAAKTQSENADIKCDTSKFKFRAVSEVGFTSVLAHHIQLGREWDLF